MIHAWVFHDSTEADRELELDYVELSTTCDNK